MWVWVGGCSPVAVDHGEGKEKEDKKGKNSSVRGPGLGVRGRRTTLDWLLAHLVSSNSSLRPRFRHLQTKD